MQSPNVKEAKALKDKQLFLVFENGEEKMFDLKPYLHFPIFKKLVDEKEFLEFDIVDGTVEWKCGADLSPDTFYIESVTYKYESSAMN